jgi:hypothetical protein
MCADFVSADDETADPRGLFVGYLDTIDLGASRAFLTATYERLDLVGGPFEDELDCSVAAVRRRARYAARPRGTRDPVPESDSLDAAVDDHALRNHAGVG